MTKLEQIECVVHRCDVAISRGVAVTCYLCCGIDCCECFVSDIIITPNYNFCDFLSKLDEYRCQKEYLSVMSSLLRVKEVMEKELCEYGAEVK